MHDVDGRVGVGLRAVRLIGLLLFVGLLALLSQVLSSYSLTLATRILIFAIFAMSLDLLVGYVGLSSLGHAAFFGFSGYAVGLLALRVANNLLLEFLASVAATLVLAAIFGALALRARGVYFLMLTLALAQVVWGIAYEWRSLTGGDDGLPGIPRPIIGSVHFTDASSFYLFCTVAFVVCGSAMLLIVRSPFGLTLEGIRESASRMATLGYNVWLHRYLAWMIAALFAGIAGALQAWQNGIMSPAQLGVVTSAEALLMVIVGGAGTMVGPFVGSIIVVLLEYLVSQHTERWVTVLGIIYIFAVVGAPKGVYPPIRAAGVVLLGRLSEDVRRSWIPRWMAARKL